MILKIPISDPNQPVFFFFRSIKPVIKTQVQKQEKIFPIFKSEFFFFCGFIQICSINTPRLLLSHSHNFSKRKKQEEEEDGKNRENKRIFVSFIYLFYFKLFIFKNYVVLIGY